MSKSCMTCAWAGCRNYGKQAGPCMKYIEELKPIKPAEKG